MSLDRWVRVMLIRRRRYSLSSPQKPEGAGVRHGMAWREWHGCAGAWLGGGMAGHGHGMVGHGMGHGMAAACMAGHGRGMAQSMAGAMTEHGMHSGACRACSNKSQP